MQPWDISSAGRAPRSQRGGRQFDPAMFHHFYFLVVVRSYLSGFVQNDLSNINEASSEVFSYVSDEIVQNMMDGVILLQQK